MEHNQPKNSTTTWIVIDFAFIAVIVILLFSFLSKSTSRATLQARDTISLHVSSWINQLADGAESAVSFGNGIKEYAELRNGNGSINSGVDKKEIVSYVKSVIDYSDFSHLFVCAEDKVLYDENGNESIDFDISFCKGNTKPAFYCIDNAPFEDGNRQLVTYVPISNEEFVLIFTDITVAAGMLEGNLFDNCSFLAILDESGDLVCNFDKYNDRDSIYLANENVIATLEGAVGSKTLSEVKNGLTSGEVGFLEAEISGDKRTIALSNLSVGSEKWTLVYGVRQQNIDAFVSNSTEEAREAILKFAIVMAVFSIFVITTVIIYNLRSKEHGRELEDKADTDLLTNLYNKTATERKIQEYLDDSPNSRGLMFILDIDNFKKVNDTMGHAFGDTLLKTLGKEIKAEFRVSDIIGRTGGDEFMVFLKDVNDDVIVEREANRITKFFHDFKAGGDYVKYSATASIGAAIYPDDAKSFKDLYVAADQALYRAKKRGKNQLVFYNEDNTKQ